jgi:hypothetical protein
MRRLILAALLYAAPAQAQEMIMAPGSLAETYCLGGRITSVMNMELLGTDSLLEISVHEAVHRVQMERNRLGPGQCPPPLTTVQLLKDEVEAYCASRPFRIAQGFTKEEVDLNYLSRLQNQLGRVFPEYTIASTYTASCP